MNRIFNNPFGQFVMTLSAPFSAILAVAVGMFQMQYGFDFGIIVAVVLFLVGPYLFGACKYRNFKYPAKNYFGYLGLLIVMVAIASVPYLLIISL